MEANHIEHHQCGSKRPPSASIIFPTAPASPTSFIIQTPHGLEHVAAEEIRRVFASQIVSVEDLPQTNGIIVVKINDPPSPALLNSISRLACADAAAIYCGHYEALPMNETAIEVLKREVGKISWNSLLDSVYWPLMSRERHQSPPTFRCTCSRTQQMADWGYNCLPDGSEVREGTCADAALDPAVIFARCSDTATSQMASHVSLIVYSATHGLTPPTPPLPNPPVFFVAHRGTGSRWCRCASVWMAGACAQRTLPHSSFPPLTLQRQVKLKDFSVEVHVWVHNTTAAIGLTLPRPLLLPPTRKLNHRVLTTLRPSV
jgi:hypothetical protein